MIFHPLILRIELVDADSRDMQLTPGSALLPGCAQVPRLSPVSLGPASPFGASARSPVYRDERLSTLVGRQGFQSSPQEGLLGFMEVVMLVSNQIRSINLSESSQLHHTNLPTTKYLHMPVGINLR